MTPAPGFEAVSARLTRPAVLLAIADETTRRRLALANQALSLGSIETVDGTEALRLANLLRPDAMVVDLRMPGINGIELCRRLRSSPQTAEIPVVIVSEAGDVMARAAAIASGAVRFAVKPLDGHDISVCLRSLALRSPRSANLATAECRSPDAMTVAEMRAAGRRILDSLGQSGNPRRHRAPGRPDRVGRLAAAIGTELGLGSRRTALLQDAASMRDIGMLGLPERLRAGSAPLSAEDEALRRAHTSIGHMILMHQPPSPLAQMASRIALNHHECWDGSGFPRGLVADAIPIEARITALADSVHDWMGDAGPAGPEPDMLMTQVIRHRGSRFDPLAVDAFTKALPGLLAKP